MALCQQSRVVYAHNHANAGWEAQLEESNCTANYSTALSSVSRSDGENGTWVTSASCFNLQMEFMAVAGCKYFSEVVCEANCDSSFENAAYDGTVDDYGNEEYSYCGLFCRNRLSAHPSMNSSGHNISNTLGCAHAANATRCGCPIDSCEDLLVSDSESIDDPPTWCKLYCDKAADSCTINTTTSGCAFAEAVATETGSFVNISRDLSFTIKVSENATASGETPSLDSVCSTADLSCNHSSSDSGCSISELNFEDFGTDDATVTGVVTGLLDAPLTGLLDTLVLKEVEDVTDAPIVVDVEPSLRMICVGSVRHEICLLSSHCTT